MCTIDSTGRIRQTLRWLGVDRAVLFSIFARAWQLISGPVTIVLMAFWFTPELRGYFYTFSSLLALQVFFELSLHIVIISVASHEWARLSTTPTGSIQGDPAALSRLVSLGRRSLAWYAVAGMLFVIVCTTAGVLFLSQRPLPQHEWLGPWIALVAITGLLLAVQPLSALLEGCDQLTAVNQFRFGQAVTGSLVVWLSIVSGWGLWAIVGSQFVRLIWEACLVFARYGTFFRPFLSSPSGPYISWRDEVWPLQWRLALQGVATWWALWLFTPVVFHFHGDVEAGRMGMTWNVLIALQGAAFAWIETRRPRFGQLIAEGKYQALDAEFFRFSAISVAVLAGAAVAFWLVVLGLHFWNVPVARRLVEAFLPPLPTFVLACGVILYQIPNCQVVYIRAHKQDPFLVASLALCSIVAAGIIWFGRQYGAIGAVSAWTCSIGVFQLPLWTWIWRRCRREWHRLDATETNVVTQSSSQRLIQADELKGRES